MEDEDNLEVKVVHLQVLGNARSTPLHLNVRHGKSYHEVSFERETKQILEQLSRSGSVDHGYAVVTFPCKGANGQLDEITAMATVDKGDVRYAPSVRCPRLQPEVEYVSKEDYERTGSYRHCRVEESKELPDILREEELREHGLMKCPFAEHHG